MAAGAGNILFNNTVNGAATGTKNLSLTAGTGNITFNGAVGAGSAIGNLTANSTGITAFNQTVKAASLTTDAGGTTQIKGNVTTTSTQTYGDAVTITNNPILAGSDVSFNKTVDLAGNLGIVGDNVNLKGTVTTTNKGTLTIIAVDLGQWTVDSCITGIKPLIPYGYRLYSFRLFMSSPMWRLLY